MVNVTFLQHFMISKTNKKEARTLNAGSIISVVGKTTIEIIELFECRQKVP